MKFVLMTAGVPNFNGRVYPRSAVEAAYRSIQSTVKHVILDGGGDINQVGDLSRMCGIVTDVALESDDLVIEVSTTDTPCGNIINALKHAEIDFYAYTMGTGDFNEGIVANFELKGIGLTAQKTGE